MRQTKQGNEAAGLADTFCRNNAQTAFLLKRLNGHDGYIFEHATRCAYYALLLAQGLGFGVEEQEVIYRSALLQDVGKLQIRYAQAEAGQDTEAVTGLLKHPLLSVELLRTLVDRGLVDGEAVAHHHENLDGTGYPYGLTWTDISLNARILHLADSFAALTAYDSRNDVTLGVEQALEELYRWSDTFYDADLVEVMFRHFGAETKTPAKTPLRLISR
jgi:HD-GYP domain-containing protein (c-di-GMP phosphodiesterase class II)